MSGKLSALDAMLRLCGATTCQPVVSPRRSVCRM
jgi:hypothetical protein